MRSLALIVGLTSLMAASQAAGSEDALLIVDDAPANGLVLRRLDMTEVAFSCGAIPFVPEALHARDEATGAEVPIQFVPDEQFNSRQRPSGTLIVRLPHPGSARLKLSFGSGEVTPGEPEPWDGRVVTPSYTVDYDGKRQGGLPWRITFPASGKTFSALRWSDRLHLRERGSFALAEDSSVVIRRISTGPLCTVVRVWSPYVQGGQQPPSRPMACYEWFHFNGTPLVFVKTRFTQQRLFTWYEWHVLELNDQEGAFPQWAGGEPLAEGRFAATMKSLPQADWGVIHDGQNGIGMFRCGQVLLYDGGKAGYIQAHGDSAWSESSDRDRETSSWLWIGTDSQPAAAVRDAARSASTTGQLIVTVPVVREHIDAARKELHSAPAEVRQRGWWRVQGALGEEAAGKIRSAIRMADGKLPAIGPILTAGDLGLILHQTEGGFRVVSLFDSARDQALAPVQSVPLFAITLRRVGTLEQATLTADEGWQAFSYRLPRAPVRKSTTDPLELRWDRTQDDRFKDLRVLARAVPDAAASAIRWTLTVEGPPEGWSIWRVVFPQVAVADLGPDGAVFFPKGAGQVERDVWQKPFRFTGTYPSGWTSMQFLAAYDEARQTGLYVGMHDPWGSTKDLLVESRPADRAVVLAMDHPVPNMGVAGNRFELSGEAVWKLQRGDWFDASITYRDWVRKEAKWYPKLTADGRADTPLWMREMSAWAQGHGPREQCVPALKSFTELVGTPTAVHWYDWHQIPFDNDYPHYFPTRPGFVEGVNELQAAGTSVMPYINGRLWDTHDRGAEDFEFTKVARPAVSKDEKGEPYIETYGSKEQDGSPVRLGVMCPSTELWQSQMQQTVLRLMNECGVKGVYIDQIAAAQPTLCFDPSHGHPLGGGHWWTEGYWKLLDGIRQTMPADRMITTECNGEPYIRCFDGYLTWHWQYDGQVPAFPAVYGGAIQMFGRAYAGGPTEDLALRMRAGQQLVFGEQIGWLAPDMILGEDHKARAAFFRDVVHLRRNLARYFYAGEMARPPRLVGEVPKVRADWQWGGVDWVTTNSVFTGAWHQPASGRLALVFVNVSDDPVTARVEFDARPYGFSGPSVRLTKFTPDGPADSTSGSPQINEDATFPARSAWAWEFSTP